MDVEEKHLDDSAGEARNNRLFFRLFRAANNLHTKGTKALQVLGTTTQQWSVLGALSRPEAATGMSVGELSQYLLVSRQNLSGILDRLEREGKIDRVAGFNDRRIRRVTLTLEGARHWAHMRPMIHSFYNDALEGFSTQERELFIEYISRLQANLNRL